MALLIKAVAMFAAVSAPALAPHSTLYSDGTPPVRYQGEGAQIVLYLNDVSEFCGKATNPQYVILACTKPARDGVFITALPNPCQFDDDPYAHLACHEKGHVLGWPATHGD